MHHDTVDGRNPANHLGCTKKYVNNVMVYLSTGAGFLASTVFSRNRGERDLSVGWWLDLTPRWRSLQEDAAHPVSVSNFLG